MDLEAHARVKKYFKGACVQHNRPLKTVLQHYSHMVSYELNKLIATHPDEELVLLRRGFLSQLRIDRGKIWGFDEKTRYVVVMNSSADYVIVHGRDVEIVMGAFGSNATMVRNLFEMEAYMDTFSDGHQRVMVAYVVSPWYVCATDIAYELRCTRIDGGMDCEAIATKQGSMMLDTEGHVSGLEDTHDVDAKLRIRVLNQFCSKQSKYEVEETVPRAMAEKLVEQSRADTEKIARMEKEMSRLLNELNAMSVKLRAHEDHRQSVEEMRREMEAECEKKLQQKKAELDREHKEALDAACKSASIAQQEAILLLDQESKSTIDRMQQQINRLTKEHLEAQSKLTRADDYWHRMLDESQTHAHQQEQSFNEILSEYRYAETDRMKRLAHRFAQTLVTCQRKRLCTVLATYLRHEARVREDALMQSSIIRKRAKQEFQSALAMKTAENTMLREMISDCDIDIFTQQQAIKEIQRVNRVYVQNLILDKRKRGNRYSSELPVVDVQTRRALVRDWRKVHEIATNGFFYPIRYPPSTSPSAFLPQDNHSERSSVSAVR